MAKPKKGKSPPAATRAPIPLKLARKALGRAVGRVTGYGAWLKR